MGRILLAVLFFVGLIYLVWPGPSSIEDIPPIPNSLKSDEPGDTTQISNIAAYFSLEKRDYITKFYHVQFNYLNFLGLQIPPLRFNHPVENAKVNVRDQIQSTYLEEFSYPFRDSLFVNGYDKDVWNKINHVKNDDKNQTIIINGEVFNSKTILRYYPSSVWARVIVYIFIWVLLTALAKFSYQAWKKY